jgi:hypothetical protein
MTLKESSMQVIPKFLRDYVELIPTLKFPNWWRIRLSQSKVSAILGTVQNAINKYDRRIQKCPAEGLSQRPQLAITPFRQQFNTMSQTGVSPRIVLLCRLPDGKAIWGLTPKVAVMED